jgi:hypothetical protein
MVERRRGGWVGGLVLILLGVIFLIQQINPDLIGGWIFLIGLALVFLVAYVMTRQYGFLIPGCILLGLGIPVALMEQDIVSDPTGQGGLVVFGLGLGFVAIWLVDMLVARGRPGAFWPLIPGVILFLVGISILAENEQWLTDIGQWWPLVLIIIGVWILIDRLLRKPS